MDMKTIKIRKTFAIMSAPLTGGMEIGLIRLVPNLAEATLTMN
jgi:hypothetical protein